MARTKARKENIDEFPGMSVEGDETPQLIPGGAPGVDAQPLPVLTEQAPIVKTAVKSPETVPQPDKYRVKDAPPGQNGQRFYTLNTSTGQTRLPEGKIIDPREYDLRLLKAQGIKLEKIDPVKEAADLGY